MTRPQLIFMPLVVGYAKRSFKPILLTFILAEAICIPWGCRNLKEFGTYIPYTQSSYYLWCGFNPSITNGSQKHKTPNKGEKGYSEELQKALSDNNLKETERLSRKLMLEYVLSDPLAASWHSLERVFTFIVPSKESAWPIELIDSAKIPIGYAYWMPRPIYPGLWSTLEKYFYGGLSVVAYTGLFTTFILSLLCLMPVTHKIKIVLLVMVLLTLEHLIIYPSIKYRYPIEPLMMIIAANWITKLKGQNE